MITVSDCTYKKARRGDLGMELEVEAMKKLPTIKAMGWESKADGSLRYIGMEYVTSSPIKCDDHKRVKLQFLVDSILKDGEDVQRNSHRTSFHVHRNVSSWAPHQVWNATVAYYLLENLLMKYCGKHREGNQFCLRLKDATSVIDTLKHDIRLSLRKKNGGNPFISLGEADIKYGGLNMKAVAGYGSMEFRGMRGAINADVLDKWSGQLFSMTKTAAEEFKDPAHLMDTYFAHDPLIFASKFFDKGFFEELIALADGKAESLIIDNEPLVCELAYAVDWNKWMKRVEEGVKSGDPEWENSVALAIKEVSRSVIPVVIDELPDNDAQLRNGMWLLKFDRAQGRMWMSVHVAELLAARHRLQRSPENLLYYIELDRLLKRGGWAVQGVGVAQRVPRAAVDDDI